MFCSLKLNDKLTHYLLKVQWQHNCVLAEKKVLILLYIHGANTGQQRTVLQ